MAKRLPPEGSRKAGRGYHYLIYIVVASMALVGLLWESRRNWEVTGARVLDGQGLLMIRLHGSKWKKGTKTKVVTVDLGSGQQLGQYQTSYWMKTFGLTKRQLWIRQGGFGGTRWTGLDLPKLTEVFELKKLLKNHPEVGWPVEGVMFDADDSGSLVMQTADKRCYTLVPMSNQLALRTVEGCQLPTHDVLRIASCGRMPRPPRAIGNDLLLDSAYVCDNTRGDPIDLGGGDRLVAYQDLMKTTGKLILGRLTADNRWIWRFHERDRLGDRGRKDPGYRVAFATRLPASLLLVINQANDAGDVWVLNLDPASGAQRWFRHYE